MENQNRIKEREDWLKQYHVKTIEIDVKGITQELEKELNELKCTNMIRSNQLKELGHLIETTLAFVKLMSPDDSIFEQGYPLQMIKFMTYGEAELATMILKKVCNTCWNVVEEEEAGWQFRYERILTSEFMEVLKEIGEFLPFIKEVMEDLSPLTDRNVFITRRELEKLERYAIKLKAYSYSRVIENIHLPFRTVFERRHFLSELYHFLACGVSEAKRKEMIYSDVLEDVLPFLKETESISLETKEYILNNEKCVKELKRYTELIVEKLRFSWVEVH